VESTRLDTLRVDKQLVHLRSFFKSMRLLPNTLYLFLLTIMVWQKEELNINGHGKKYEE